MTDRVTAGECELLAAPCAGHPDAFSELFRRHQDRMWAVPLRITRDSEAADAVQDGYSKGAHPYPAPRSV